MALKLGDLVPVWDLYTTGLPVYYQEPMEMVYAILCVVKGVKAMLQFRQVGTTIEQLTSTDVAVSPKALKTQGIPPEMLDEGGMPLSMELKTLGIILIAAKGEKDLHIFFDGANSDSFDMKMMKYTFARRLADVDMCCETMWFDMLTRLGVVGTINMTRLVSSFEIFDR